jgi:hypothetical protein
LRESDLIWRDMLAVVSILDTASQIPLCFNTGAVKRSGKRPATDAITQPPYAWRPFVEGAITIGASSH